MILGQWSNPVSGSRKSQASSQWAKKHRVKLVPSWRYHIQGWMNVRESYLHALEQGTLVSRRIVLTALSLSLSLSGELGDELLEKWRKTITRSRRPHCLYSRLISDSASKTLDEMRQTVRLSELMSRCLAEFSRLISLYRREMLLLFKQGCAFLLLFKQGCHNFSR